MAPPASAIAITASALDAMVAKLNFFISKTPPALLNMQVDAIHPGGRMFTGGGRIATSN
jgi:hypothetical protein